MSCQENLITGNRHRVSVMTCFSLLVKSLPGKCWTIFVLGFEFAEIMQRRSVGYMDSRSYNGPFSKEVLESELDRIYGQLMYIEDYSWGNLLSYVLLHLLGSRKCFRHIVKSSTSLESQSYLVTISYFFAAQWYIRFLKTEERGQICSKKKKNEC